MQGVPGKVTRLDVDLDREHRGVVGHATALLDAGGQQATLTLAAQLAPDGTGTSLQAGLTPISPATLAGAAPQLASLAALDAPVALSGNARLGPALDLLHAEATAVIGAGTVHAGQGTAPLRGAELRVTEDPGRLVLNLVRLDTAATPDATPTRFTGNATAVTEAGGGYDVTAAMDVDQVAAADLAALWPAGTGGPGTRPWMTENITAGRFANGHVELELTLPPDLSDVGLKRIKGSLDGHDLTVYWLRPVPPVEHGEATLTITDPDVIDVAVASGIQGGGSFGGMRHHDATIHLTGIAGKNQFAEINDHLSGPLPDLIAVLNNPRIGLLSRRPLPMRDPRGNVTAQVHVGRLPLRDDVKMDDLVIDTTAHVTNTHLGGIAGGYDLSDGDLTLAANNDGLTAGGTASLAGFPSTLKLGMDFRDGPPAQVQENVAVHATVAVARLAALGIAVGKQVGGSAAVDASLAAHRSGVSDIAVNANLADITVAAPEMGFVKRAGQPGSASVRVKLDHDRLASIDALRVEGPDIRVLADAELQDGKPVGVRFERLMIHGDTDLTGDIRVTGPEHRVAIRLSGPSVDLSPLTSSETGQGSAAKSAAVSPGPTGSKSLGGQPWSLDLTAGKVVLGPGRQLGNVHAVAESDGAILGRASLSGAVTAPHPGGPIQADITPDAGGRRLTVAVADTGALLDAAGLGGTVSKGKLHVTARWPNQSSELPLGGVAELTDFRVLDAPAIGRVLKALTVYGVADLLSGPGLGFSRLTAPFGYDRRVLTLRDARAVSPSLGLTATGRIDLASRTADLKATVVPAYMFNSLLGRLPLVGQLFTAEKGGGLFAADMTITGPLDDLQTHVNPLSALTPGILRRMFGSDTPGN